MSSEHKTPQEEEEDKNLLLPNKGLGCDHEKYSWGQDLKEVTVTVPVPKGTRGRDAVVEFKPTSIKIGLKGQEPILAGELFKPVLKGECTWQIEDGEAIVVYLTKQNQQEWWGCVVNGEPLVNTRKINPESSKLSDLDDETRSVVEKMMFDQRAKETGQPTSEERKNQAMMKKIMEKNPEMFAKMQEGGVNPTMFAKME